MTNKRYTDEEIKKALANCAFSAYNPDACTECHYNNVGAPTCVASCTNDALELIYRQESEIERLQKEVNLVSILFQDEQERAEEYRLKIENLQNVISNQQIEISAKIENKIKTEAYKEFAERLKDAFPECNRDCKCPAIDFDDYCYIIDECCEEMDGEEE